MKIIFKVFGGFLVVIGAGIILWAMVAAFAGIFSVHLGFNGRLQGPVLLGTFILIAGLATSSLVKRDKNKHPEPPPADNIQS
ncbi:MAG: hypothetical protein AAB019_00410 [Planctomycetota bacterium]